MLFAAIAGQANVFAQGFGGYVAPTNGTQAGANADVIAVESVEQARREGIATVNPNATNQRQVVQPGSNAQNVQRVGYGNLIFDLRIDIGHNIKCLIRR